MVRLSPLDVSFLHIEDADRMAHMHIASIAISYNGEVTFAVTGRSRHVPPMSTCSPGA